MKLCASPPHTLQALELEAASHHRAAPRGLLLPLPLEAAPFASWNLMMNTELRQTEQRPPPADAFLLTTEHCRFGRSLCKEARGLPRPYDLPPENSGQEETGRTEHETTDWFQVRKAVLLGYTNIQRLYIVTLLI